MIRRIWVAILICPSCDREHCYEAETQIDVIAPEKLGMGALCGHCEAMRRCWYTGVSPAIPFWDETAEARAWLNLRRYPDRYQMQAFETDPHDQPLRDDQRAQMARLIRAPTKKGYEPRCKYRWNDDELHARGIEWLIPRTTKTF